MLAAACLTVPKQGASRAACIHELRNPFGYSVHLMAMGPGAGSAPDPGPETKSRGVHASGLPVLQEVGCFDLLLVGLHQPSVRCLGPCLRERPQPSRIVPVFPGDRILAILEHIKPLECLAGGHGRLCWSFGGCLVFCRVRCYAGYRNHEHTQKKPWQRRRVRTWRLGGQKPAKEAGATQPRSPSPAWYEHGNVGTVTANWASLITCKLRPEWFVVQQPCRAYRSSSARA